MAGQKGKSGGARKGSGRKAKTVSEELRGVMEQAWQDSDRLLAIERMKQIVQGLDPNASIAAWRALMSYSYGMPANGDELRAQEAVDDAIETLLSTLQKALPPADYERVESALGIDGVQDEKEEESGEEEG